jgi:hypothetical protein
LNPVEQKSSMDSTSRRPVFLVGGTFSLNAIFVSTTLLASRLSSNSSAYVVVSMAIVLFVIYPVLRHAISQRKHGSISKSDFSIIEVRILLMRPSITQYSLPFFPF